MYDLKFATILHIILILLLLAGSLSAINPGEEPVKSLISRGIELTINNRFAEAQAIYDGIIDRYPHHPMGYFYKGATLQAQMLDHEDLGRADEFLVLMDRTVRCADSLKKSGKADAWIYFYEGSAFLYRSYLKVKQNKWFGAYRDATRGVNRLEKAIRLDSLLYDAYLGVGSFKYWKSRQTHFLNWLPFVADDREGGIAMVREAVEKGTFAHWVGRDQLCWILQDAGQHVEALQIAKENCRIFPDSRFFKWTLVSAAFKAGEFDLSYRNYNDLLDSIRKLPDNNHYNELDCLVSMAEIELQRNNQAEALRFSDEALHLSLDKDVRKRARGKLEKALQIRNAATKEAAKTAH